MLCGTLAALLVAASLGVISSQPAAGQSLPVITISGGAQITEGGLAKFTITANPAPTEAILIAYTVEDAPGANFLWSTQEGPQITYLSKGATAKVLNYRTVADSSDEPSGPVKVTVNPRSGYTVGSQSSATVQVLDDYEIEMARDIYRVGLSGPGSSTVVREGESVTITASLNRTNSTGSPLVIPLKAVNGIASTADYTVASSISIPDGDSSASTTVTIVDDRDPEDFERVTIRLGRLLQKNLGERRDLTGREVSFFIRWSDAPDLGLLLFRVCEAADNNCPLDGDEGWVETHTPSITLIEGGDPVSYQYKLSQTETPFRATSVYPRFEWNGSPLGPLNNDRRDCKASSAHAQVPRGPNSYPRQWHNRCPHKGNYVGPGKRNDWHTVTFSAGEDIDAYNHSATVYHDTVAAKLFWLGRDLMGSYYADPTGRRWPVHVTVLDDDEWDQDFEFSADGIAWRTIRDGVRVSQMLPDVLTPGETYQFWVRLRDRDEGTRKVDVLNLYVKSHSWTVTLSDGSTDWPGKDLVLDFHGNAAKVATVNVHVADNAKPGNVLIKETTPRGFYARAGIEGLNGERHSWLGTVACIGCTPVPPTQPTIYYGPKLRIDSKGDVTEGADAVFTVTATPAPEADLDVGVTIAASGDHGVATGSRTITLGTGGTATVTVSTTGDTADEPDGSVTATLQAGSGYEVLAYAESHTAAVADDDPLPTVTLKSSSTSVSEGDSATITASLSNPSTEDVTLEVSAVPVDPTPSRYGSLGANTRLTIPAGSTNSTGSVTFTSTEDSVYYPTAAEIRRFKITATASGGRGVADPSGAITIKIRDDEPPLVVSISAGPGVTEGSPAKFTLTATPAPTFDLMVDVTIAPVGDFGISAGARTVTIPTTGTATLSLATTDDSTDEPNGSIIAGIQQGADHIPASPPTATVDVADDDPPLQIGEIQEVPQTPDTPESQEVPQTPQTPRLHLLSELPELTVSAVRSSEVEGSSAWFVVSASPAPEKMLLVAVELEWSGDFGAAVDDLVLLDSQSAFAWVGTMNDLVDEADGSVTLKLVPGDGYRLGAAASASVGITDDDDAVPSGPAVQIAAVAEGVFEGEDAVFTLTAEPAQNSPLAVTVAVAAVGLSGVAQQTRTVTIPSGASTTFSFATTDDGAFGGHGEVAATVSAGSGYRVGLDNTAAVTVLDDDIEGFSVSKVSIAGGGPVDEGQDAVFTLTASPAPAWDVPAIVSVTVRDGDGQITSTTEHTVTIPQGTTTATLRVGTTDDQTDTAGHGSVAAAITRGHNLDYRYGQTLTATITVNDNDNPPPPPPPDDPPADDPPPSEQIELHDCTGLPTISVSDVTASPSDTSADFTISLDCKPTKDVTVYYVVAREGIIGTTTTLTLTNTKPTHTATVTIGTTQNLAVHVVYATGTANRNAEGTLAYTDP